jgi:tetratricopeptide (TPR) repeat protein
VTGDLRDATCPGAEELAVYVEGRATATERLAIQRHLANCENCREVVSGVARDVPAAALPFWKRRDVHIIGSSVLAVAASLLVVVQLRPDLNPFGGPTPYEELVAAVGTDRTVEGRLTGGFEFGPLRSPVRSGAAQASERFDVLAAAARIRDRASADENAENLRAMGVAQLLLGQLDDAIASLQKSVDARDTPRANSDLAAAYLERGRRMANPEDYEKALASAERAIKEDPSLPEPYFNRALALEYLHQSDAARKAWEAASQHESNSRWAEEARKRSQPR